MPSLFVWKATYPLISTSILYYSGSNWFLEEHSTYSKSAMYLNQQTLSNYGWMYDIKWMPTNWVGSHLLENVFVPYALIKEDALGRLEQLGEWMRFTTYREVEDKEAEWERIQQWVMAKPSTASKPSIASKPFVSKIHTNPSYIPSTSSASCTSYEPCLIKLSGHLPVSHRNDSRPNQKYYQPRHQPQHQPRQQPYQKKMISA
jgi:hypothetical protein